MDTRKLHGSGLTAPAPRPVVDNRVLGGAGLTQIPLAERQAMINLMQGGPTTYGGSKLDQIPLAQRQAFVGSSSSGNRFGQGLNTPQGPVRPQQMQMQRPQQAPQQRTGGPGPVRPQQSFAPQQRAPQPRPQPQQQQRPGPSFFQQALSYAKPVSQGISALGSLFSFF
jgi:hypothetical protein